MNKYIVFSKLFLKFISKEIFSIVLFLPGLILMKYFLIKKESLIVLNYHNFSKYNNYKIERGNILETGYADNFEKQMKFLKKYFNFCYPEEYFNSECKNKGNLLITFDDGYKDNYEIAFPILKKYHVKSIFFIVTNIISTKNWLWHDKVRYLVNTGNLDESDIEMNLKMMNRGKEISANLKERVNLIFDKENVPELMMSWNEVENLYKSGFIIGAHTKSHQVLSFIDYNSQKIEIESSLSDINEMLNIKTKYFAFPNGLFNKDTLNLLKKNKIEYAFSTKSGYNKKYQNRLKINRIGVNASDSIPVLLLKLLINLAR